jgi:hypothetical protein
MPHVGSHTISMSALSAGYRNILSTASTYDSERTHQPLLSPNSLLILPASIQHFTLYGTLRYWIEIIDVFNTVKTYITSLKLKF